MHPKNESREFSLTFIRLRFQYTIQIFNCVSVFGARCLLTTVYAPPSLHQHIYTILLQVVGRDIYYYY